MPGKAALDCRWRYGPYWSYATKKEANQARSLRVPQSRARRRRRQGNAVRRYLEALERSRPRRGRRPSADALKVRLEEIEAKLADADPLQRLHLIQERATSSADRRSQCRGRGRPSRARGGLRPRRRRVRRSARASTTRPGARPGCLPRCSRRPASTGVAGPRTQPVRTRRSASGPSSYADLGIGGRCRSTRARTRAATARRLNRAAGRSHARDVASGRRHCARDS